jgi:hypothetical protein
MMEAVFVNNLIEQSVLTPDEVVDAFLGACAADRVEKQLWEVFRYAVLGGLKETGVVEDRLSAEEVASLFDQLMALVRALEALREGKSGARYWGLKDGGDGDV